MSIKNDPASYTTVGMAQDARRAEFLARNCHSPAIPKGTTMQNEITEAMVEVASKAYADHTEYYIQFHRGLSSPSADKIRAGMRLALSAALAAAEAQEPVAEPMKSPKGSMRIANFDTTLSEETKQALAAVDRAMLSARPTPPCDGRAGALDIPLEIAMHAERLYDEGGYKSVPTIIAEAIMAERERWAESATELADLMDDVVSGNYTPDSFTTQPIRALTQKDKADE